MKTYRIATIPGDGIGKEVVPEGQKVLEALARQNPNLKFEFENFDWGGDYYKKHGLMMPVDGREQIAKHDAILFGSGEDAIRFSYDDGLRAYDVRKPFEGVVKNLERRYLETESEWAREEISRFMSATPCAAATARWCICCVCICCCCCCCCC